MSRIHRCGMGFCGEGACSRSVAQQPQKLGAATQPSGSKLPRHKSTLSKGSSVAVRQLWGIVLDRFRFFIR
ncbi:hypothetical protein B1219_22255 [Pseudomonas ogarae]|nr:hypothetical protein B1219_22255 [Pseudomonas ogarae]OPG79491.1 hypothetical protein B1218_10190 [Pseudomonas ogarae]